MLLLRTSELWRANTVRYLFICSLLFQDDRVARCDAIKRRLTLESSRRLTLETRKSRVHMVSKKIVLVPLNFIVIQVETLLRSFWIQKVDLGTQQEHFRFFKSHIILPHGTSQRTCGKMNEEPNSILERRDARH